MSALFPDYRPTWETDDHRLLREHARAFFAKEMTPNQEKWSTQKHVDRETWLRTGEARACSRRSRWSSVSQEGR